MPEVLYCRRCGAPLAKKLGSIVRVVKRSRGKPISVDIDVRYSGPGVLEISCTDCKGKITGHNFITLQLSREETEKLKKRLTPTEVGLK